MRITAYRNDRGVYLQPHVPRTGAPDVPGTPCLHVKALDERSVGEAVMRCLAQAHVDSDEDSYEQLMRLAGVKNLKAFQLHARIVSIDATQPEITFWPTRSLGPRRGYLFIEGPPGVTDPEPSTLGQCVLRSFEMCE